MSVTASAVIASAFIGSDTVDAATYKVKPGDTLWKISQQHGTSVSQLKSWNGLTSEIIFPNQQLKVSGSSTEATSSKKSNASSSSKSSASKSAATYTVKKGDTLSRIAAAHGVSVSNLMKWNNLNSHLIYPGQVFKVSAGTTNKSSSNASSSKSSSSASKAKSSSSSSSNATYTVKRGDTLSQIAAAHGISVKNLMSWNNLSTTLIYPGNKLVVKKPNSTGSSSSNKSSGSSSSSSSGKSSSGSSSSNGTTTYTVKSGDSLSKIASQYGVTVKNLMDWNNLKSTTIYIGDKLTIGGKASSAPKNNSGSSSGSSSSNVSASSVVNVAKSALGTPYAWGGTTTSGFDCSGFIYWAFNQAGQKISRLSTDGYYNRSYIVNNPQVGDLVFFEGTYRSGISHMGIYLGNNQFIHAGSSTGVTIANLNNSYWSKHFHSFKRFY